MLKSALKKINCSGDLLFTHRNLSGPAILDFSRYADKNDVISISFTQKKYYNIENDSSNIDLSAINYISRKTGLPKRFLNKMDTSLAKKKWKSFSESEREKMFNKISEMDFIVESKSFKNAMVTRGGVNKKEIKSHCMESNSVEGLYFCGEMIDIDGKSGGYNIQAAFSTAYSVAEDIIKKAKG